VDDNGDNAINDDRPLDPNDDTVDDASEAEATERRPSIMI
jgi:hypothetical protein